MLLVILSVGIARDVLVLFQSSAAVGVDGYYYVIQIDTLRQYGHLYYPTNTPLILYLLSAASVVIGNTVLTLKLGSILLHTLLCLGICSIISSVTRHLWLGILGSAIAVSSGLHLYLVTEYVNSLGALTMLLWSMSALIRASQRRSVRWLICAATLLLMAVLSHRLILALLLLIAISAFLSSQLLNSGYKKRAGALVILLLLWVAPALISAQPFFELPVWLRREFLIIPQWPLRRFDFAEGLMLLGASLLTLFLVVRGRNSEREKFVELVCVALVIASLLVFLNPFLNHHTGFQGIAGRLSSILYIQAALLFPIVIGLLSPVYRHAHLLAIAACGLLLLASVIAPLPHGATTQFLARREQLIQQLPAHRQGLCDAPIIIAQHGEQFVVTSVLGVPAQQRPPSTTQYKCTYWLLHRVQNTLVQSGQDILFSEESGFVSVLIEDGELRSLLSQITADEYRQLLAANPHLRMYLVKREQGLSP